MFLVLPYFLIKVCITHNCELNSLMNKHITLLGMIRQKKKVIKMKVKLNIISSSFVCSTSNNALQTLAFTCVHILNGGDD